MIFYILLMRVIFNRSTLQHHQDSVEDLLSRLYLLFISKFIYSKILENIYTLKNLHSVVFKIL